MRARIWNAGGRIEETDDLRDAGHDGRLDERMRGPQLSGSGAGMQGLGLRAEGLLRANICGPRGSAVRGAVGELQVQPVEEDAMGFSSEVQKVESVVKLPFALLLVGGVILAITVWKGVHGFWPTTGILIGGAMTLVGGLFNKIYK
jgi:hypothetical protein